MFTIKMMKKEGVDLRAQGVWEEPSTMRDVPQIKNIHRMSNFINTDELSKALRGAGLRDIDLQYSFGETNDSNSIAISIDSHKDISRKFKDYINDRGF